MKKTVTVEDLLGREVTDSITGYTGKATGVATYIKGPSMVLVEGLDSTGRPMSDWILEERALLTAEIKDK